MEKDGGCELNDTSMIAIAQGRNGKEEQDGSGKAVKVKLLVKGEAAEGNNLSQLNCKTVFDKDENSLREDEIVGETRRDDDEEEVDPSAPRIWFSDIELEEMRRPWWNSVIIKLMGKTMGYRNFSARIKDLWARDVESEMKIIDLALGYFVVRFSSYKDCEYVLTSGPWRIANRYLAVRKWEPDFHPSRASLATTVWVRFPGLPIEFYDEELLFKMGNMVGKTIKVEKVTREVVRRGFARVAVQINLDKPLVSKFRLGILIQIVQYEGIHMVCFNCGLYAHKKDQCLGNREQQMLETTKMQPKNNVPSDSRTLLKTQESIKFQVIRRDAQIGWKKPRQGWKLNVDGCAKGDPGLAAAGGLFRNEKGDWIVGFTVNIGIATGTKAELVALLEGLKQAKELNLVSLEIETDSQDVLKLIERTTSPNGPLKSLIDDCKLILQANTGFRVNRVYRESNFCADWLANHALEQPSGSSTVDRIPPALRPLLKIDKQGKTFPRMIFG